MKFKPGEVLPNTVMEAVTGEAIKFPDPKRLVHLQFRRSSVGTSLMSAIAHSRSANWGRNRQGE